MTRAKTAAAAALIDDQRAHFGDGAAQRRELGAADHGLVHRDDEKALGAAGEIFGAARQQMSGGEVRLDQPRDRRHIGDAAAAYRSIDD